MPKTLIPSSAGVKNPSLVAFTPRQVLLSLSKTNSKMTAGKSSTLNKEDKALLLHAIAQYLQRNGFSKTFKKFRSEAQIEEDGWKGSTLDLEEICFRYLEKVKSADTNSNGLDQEEGTRKRRKKSSESGDKAVGDQSGGGTDKSINGKLSLKEKKGGEKVKLEEGKDNANKKDKKEKDRKSVSEVLVLGKVNQPSPEAEKSKDKKKKKSKSSADATIEEVDAKASVTKKRKREDSEKDSHTDNKSLDESKHGKKDILKEDTAAKTSQHDGNHLNAGQNGQVDFTEIQKTPSKPIIVKENGTQKTGEKSDTTKSTKKQCNGSAEPQSTTVKAFQRVKVDEVEFANERLKDNSYWAKDGADSGYGAKAQEVLGQVRGRDFRHEKTKKKRGSYRGGQIDLQSHSVKFNYSDEE